MYTLFYSPGACSMAVHIALLECGQTVKLEKVDLKAGQQRSPDFLKLNPRGQVPVLVDGEQVIREGAAQMLHVLEKHKSSLMPSADPARATALEWLMFGNATLHPAYSRMFFLMRNAEEGSTKEALLNVGAVMIQKLWDEVEQRLSTQPYVAGKDVTIADILLTVIANWSGNVPRAINFGENTKKLFRTIIARPTYQQAMQVEGVEYKAAA